MKIHSHTLIRESIDVPGYNIDKGNQITEKTQIPLESNQVLYAIFNSCFPFQKNSFFPC